jgi:diaminopimelate decarboxylase
MFNVESEGELATVAARAAQLKQTARVALRVNPDVAADTHPYISTGLHQHKFGVPMDQARALYRSAAAEKYLQVAGVSSHIGSQILDVTTFTDAVSRLADLVRELRGARLPIQYLDAGGGLGIPYHHNDATDDFPARAARYAKAVLEPLRGLKLHLLLEPGRAIVGPAGALVTRVVYRKQNNSKRFLVVDAAMNDLIRPSLYGAFHEIVRVAASSDDSECCGFSAVGNASDDRQRQAGNSHYDIVGPICESGDFFARDRELPATGEGDLLAILDTGAYGMAISSNYNTRPRAAEVLVDGRSVRVIRRRESVSDLLRHEL